MNFPLDTHPTYIQQWGISYERQVGKDWLLSANYIGNKSTHLWAQFDANHANFIPGTCNGAACSTVANVNQRRTLAQLNPKTGAFFGQIATLDDGANANYNGLILKAQHRFSQNFTVLGSYTWSHCLQDSQHVHNLSTRAWLNTAAFTANTVGAFGNAGWNSLTGPGYFNMDVSVIRWFTIHERQKAQLRFAFFNSTNHMNFGNPSSGLNVSTFGTILSAGSPRILQLAAKYVF